MDGQREFISAHADSTDIVEQVFVPTAGEFGVLIPAPAQPTIDPNPVPASDLQALDDATRPTINLVKEVPESGSGGGGGCSLGCGATGAAAAAPEDGGAILIDTGVRTGPTLTVGPVNATPLTATTPEALNGWLAQNGFSFPDGGEAIVDSYVDAGAWFVALTQAADAGIPDGGISVGIHYSVPAVQLGMQLRMASVGAGGTMAFTVFVVSESAVGPSNAKALTLDDLSTALLEQSYAEAVESAVSSAGGRALLIEGEYPSSVAGGALAALVSPSPGTLTRLSTLVTPAEMTYDPVLAPPGPPGVVDTLTIQEGLASRARRHLGLLGLLLFGTIFLRRNWLRES